VEDEMILIIDMEIDSLIDFVIDLENGWAEVI
jgi:hypothetical protein